VMWTGHVARMGDGRGVYRFWLGGQNSKDHWQDLGECRKFTLRWTFGR